MLAVIIPTIRLDAWLDRAVESILEQETDFPFRVIVAHDGVPPNPQLPWMSDHRVSCVYSPTRKGLAANLNDAMRHVNELYIARLDADDEALPGRLQAQLDYLVSHEDAILVSGAAVWISEDGTKLPTPIASPTNSDIRLSLLTRNRIMHPATMFRRAAFEAVGGYNESLLRREDYELWLRMGTIGAIAHLSQPLIKYRIHPNQMTQSVKPWGPPIRAINRARLALGDSMNVPRYVTLGRSSIWVIAQYMGWLRLRKSRVRKALSRPTS